MKKIDRVLKGVFMCGSFIGLVYAILTESVITFVACWFILWGIETYIKKDN